MSFGSQMVTFITLTNTGDPGRLGTKTQTRTRVDVTGCRHRPLKPSETPEWLTNISTEPWKTTAPPEAAAIAAKSTGELEVDGVTYRIIGGARPFEDFADPFKVTIYSQIQEG